MHCKQSMLAGSPFMYCSTCNAPVAGFTNVTNVDSDPAGVGAAVCVCSKACTLGFKLGLYTLAPGVAYLS